METVQIANILLTYSDSISVNRGKIAGCGVCNGTGNIPSHHTTVKNTCPKCNGLGRLRLA